MDKSFLQELREVTNYIEASGLDSQDQLIAHVTTAAIDYLRKASVRFEIPMESITVEHIVYVIKEENPTKYNK